MDYKNIKPPEECLSCIYWKLNCELAFTKLKDRLVKGLADKKYFDSIIEPNSKCGAHTEDKGLNNDT